MPVFLIRQILIPEVRQLAPLARERLLAGFAKIDEEAEAASHEAYQRELSQPGEGDGDMSLAAENAIDQGVDVYAALTALRQSTRNLLAAGLYHLFEQRKKDYEQRAERAGVKPVEFSSMPGWAKANELRLVANTTKHAEGNSAVQLRKIRPDLFQDPMFAGRGIDFVPPVVHAPLAGEGLYVSEKDLVDYENAVVALWEQVAAKHE